VGEKTMDKVKRYLLIFGMGMITIPGILFLAKVARHRFYKGSGERVDKSMYEKLRESKVALDKATDLVLRVLNHAK
jgi:hypothetical protein